MNKFIKIAGFTLALVAVFAVAGVSKAGAATSCMFTGPLTIGSSGAEVTCLQTALIEKGFSIPAGATGYFGTQTATAVGQWQASVGVSPAAGYFGAISQAAWAGSMGTGTVTPPPASGMYPEGCTSAMGFSPISGVS